MCIKKNDNSYSSIHSFFSIISTKSIIFVHKNRNLMFSRSIQHFLKSNNYPSLSPQAVFFDMDGVLFDSMPFHASAWVQAMRDMNIPFTAFEAYMNEGRTGDSTIDGAFMRTYGRNATPDEKQKIYKLKTNYFEAESKTTPMFFALEMLEYIKSKGLQIFLVTGSGQSTLIDSLQLHFPGIFTKENMITAYDVSHGKPHPEPYLKALAKSGLQAWEVVVIENAPLGIQSAKAAGLYTFGLDTGPLGVDVLHTAGADIVLTNVEELYNRWDDFILNCIKQ